MGVLKWRTSALLSCPSRRRSAPWKPMERTSKKEEEGGGLQLCCLSCTSVACHVSPMSGIKRFRGLNSTDVFLQLPQ